MPNVKVITDSLADIPPTILKELDISTIPVIVRFGTTEYRDRVDLSPTEFYQQMRNSLVLPKTAVPASETFAETYRRVAETTDQIIAIHTIGTLSGIYNTSRTAAQEITTAKIEVIDSQQVSMSLGWLVILAARAAQAGASLDEIKAIVESAIPRVHLIGMLDTLEYARKGGRLGKGAALVGTLLHVKPLLSAVHGEIVPVENVRTQKRGMERLVEIALSSGPIQELAVIHAGAPELAQQVKKLLMATFSEEHIVMAEAGPVLGTHTGPETVGIAWVNGRY